MMAITNQLPLEDIIYATAKNSTKKTESKSGYDWYVQAQHVHRPSISEEKPETIQSLKEIKEYKKDFEIYKIAQDRLDGLVHSCGASRFQKILSHFKEVREAAASFCLRNKLREPCYWRDNGCYHVCLEKWIKAVQPQWITLR